LLTSILEQVKQIAINVGEYIRLEAATFQPTSIQAKGLHDLVSYVDKTAENRIVESLDKVLQGASYINEEGGQIKRSAEFTWIIDPLDGTTNFIHRIPHYCISIALMQNDNLVMGVVYDVGSNELFSAIRGKGSFLNNKPIQTSHAKSLTESLVATGFSVNNFAQMQPTLLVLEKIIRQTRGVRRIGTAALDLSYVACGRFDAYYEFGLHAWDVAAGALIVEEAGGVLSDFSGHKDYLFGSEIIAAAPSVYKEFQSIINSTFFSK